MKNDLAGPIPPELGGLANLGTLILFDNKLVGPIPPELGGLANLRELILHSNELSGPIPPELGRLANLRTLILDGNELSGPIPPELGNAVDLVVFSVGGNRLTGVLPREFLNLTELRWVLLSFNEGLCVPGTGSFVEWRGTIGEALWSWCNESDMAVLESFYTGDGRPGLAELDGLARRSRAGELVRRGSRLAGSRDGARPRGQPPGRRAAGRPGLAGGADRTADRRQRGALRPPSAAAHRSVPGCAALRGHGSLRPGGRTVSNNGWTASRRTTARARGAPPISDRDVLAQLYRSTGGSNWADSDNWLTGAALGEWSGVRVDGNGRVVSINPLRQRTFRPDSAGTQRPGQPATVGPQRERTVRPDSAHAGPSGQSGVAVALVEPTFRPDSASARRLGQP